MEPVHPRLPVHPAGPAAGRDPRDRQPRSPSPHPGSEGPGPADRRTDPRKQPAAAGQGRIAAARAVGRRSPGRVLRVGPAAPDAQPRGGLPGRDGPGRALHRRGKVRPVPGRRRPVADGRQCRGPRVHAAPVPRVGLPRGVRGPPGRGASRRGPRRRAARSDRDQGRVRCFVRRHPGVRPPGRCVPGRGAGPDRHRAHPLRAADPDDRQPPVHDRGLGRQDAGGCPPVRHRHGRPRGRRVDRDVQLPVPDAAPGRRGPARATVRRIVHVPAGEAGGRRNASPGRQPACAGRNGCAAAPPAAHRGRRRRSPRGRRVRHHPAIDDGQPGRDRHGAHQRVVPQVVRRGTARGSPTCACAWASPPPPAPSRCRRPA